MASPVACVAVADASGASPQAALSNVPGLQLLLRILPFRSSKHHQHPIKLPHTNTLEELHRHPLWRYGSTAAQWPEPRSASNKPLAPAEAESALLAYVRLAAESEQQQGIRRQARQLCTADIAAELHALYTLAAIHVAHQQDAEQQGSKHHSKPSLSDGDIMQLLKAYASLEDRSSQKERPGGQQAAENAQQDGGAEWDSKAQAAAAAMGALYAFARLADQQQEAQQESQQDDKQQQQQQQLGQAPGQLQASNSSSSSNDSSSVQAFKSLAAHGSRGASSSDSMRSSTAASSSPSGDLQVLFKLAQLGLHTASS